MVELEPNYTSQDYIRFIVEGNTMGLNLIYKKYAPKITFFVLKYGGTSENAKDIFQDALLIIYGKAQEPNFKLKSSFYTFLYGICLNLWRNHSKKSEQKNISIDQYDEYEVRGIDDIVGRILKQEENNLFWLAFKKLAPEEQKLLLFYFDDNSSEEIREKMNYKSVSYTRKRICETKKKLIVFIKDDDRFNELSK